MRVLGANKRISSEQALFVEFGALWLLFWSHPHAMAAENLFVWIAGLCFLNAGCGAFIVVMVICVL